MQGTTPGSHRRGRPRTAWMDNIKTWTGLSVEESIGMIEDRDKWRNYVHGVANPRIEDGWRTQQNRTGGWWVAGVLQICILFSLVLSTANRVVGIIDAIGILGNESVPIQLAQSCWFPVLKHKYSILSNSTRKLLRLEITKILIAVYKKTNLLRHLW